MIYYTRKRYKNRVQNKPHICLHKFAGYAIIYVVRRNAVLWADKRYHSLDYEMKARYGHKIYKIALDGGFTCPNRDGLIDARGRIFCSAGGSGDFAASTWMSAAF